MRFSIRSLLVLTLLVTAFTSLVTAGMAWRNASVSADLRLSTRHELIHLVHALMAFRQATGRYPDDSEGFGALVSKPKGSVRWYGPYLDRADAEDAWGQRIRYRALTNRAEVRSPGPDGRFETEDDMVLRTD